MRLAIASPRSIRHLAPLLLALALAGLLAPPAPAGDLAEDGRGLALPAAAATFAAPPDPRGPRADVPLPAIPDWQATLERAVGGLAWGDADGDGDLDLAVGCYYANAYPPIEAWTNLVYFNNGGLLETTPSWISTDERSTADVRWADIDRDGRPELIAANGYSSYDPSVIYFNGPAGLSNLPGWTAGDASWTLGAAAADMDGDGDLDVAFANQGRDQYDPYRPVTLFRNTGTTLETMPSWSSADPANSNYIAWGDMDGSDRIVREALFTGDGSRSLFAVPTLPMEGPVTVTVDGVPVTHFAWERIAGWVSLPSAPPAGTAVAITYRNSTAPDLAVSRWASFASCVYFNSAGTLGALPGWTVSDASATEKGIAWADLEGDEDLDLAVGASSDPTVVYPNDGSTLATTPVWQAVASYFGCQDLAWGDVDGDGDLDLATVHFGNGHARVYVNQAGVLDSEPSWYYDCSSSATAIAWGDVNGDGALDLAVATARQPVMVFLNTGDPGGLGPVPPASRLALEVRPALLTGDGTLRYTLPASTGGGALSLHDLSGRRLREWTLPALPGAREMIWDGRDATGRRLATGLYLVRLRSGAHSLARTCLVLQ